MMPLEDRNERMLAHHVGGQWRAPFSTRMATAAGSLRVVLADRRDAARAWSAACCGHAGLAALDAADLADRLDRAGLGTPAASGDRPAGPLLLPGKSGAEVLLAGIGVALARRCAVIALAAPALADPLLERFHAVTLVGWPPGAVNLLYTDADGTALF